MLFQSYMLAAEPANIRASHREGLSALETPRAPIRIVSVSYLKPSPSMSLSRPL